jgi:hypothetical protein
MAINQNKCQINLYLVSKSRQKKLTYKIYVRYPACMDQPQTSDDQWKLT